jgi:hypothetical protein
MDKLTKPQTHKRADTPIIRNRVTKKRLLAYELHIETHELQSELAQQLRSASRSQTPEPQSRSQPISPETLTKVVFKGRELYVRPKDLLSPLPEGDVTPESGNIAPSMDAFLAASKLLSLGQAPVEEKPDVTTKPKP